MRGSHRIVEHATFRSRAAEAVQGIDDGDLARYVWFFHEPSSPHLLRCLLWHLFLKLLRVAGVFLLPWLIALASFEVAQTLCLFFVFILWPIALILGFVGRRVPGVPSEFRRLIANAGGIFDPGEVLACCFFLIAHQRGIWHGLFAAPPAASYQVWLTFLGDNVLDTLTLGASSKMGFWWSGIHPQGIAGGIVSFAIKFLFAATFLETLLKARRWYMGGDFFTGSHMEASTECRERAEVPGSYVSRIGRIEEVRRTVFGVRAMSERYPTLYLAWLKARHYLRKPIMTKPGDEAKFGREATQLLGVTHVDVEELVLDEADSRTKAVTVYHTKFLPTHAIRAELDLSQARLTLFFNGHMRVRFNPVATLRTIAGQDDVRMLALYELEDLQVVGVRCCALLSGQSSGRVACEDGS